MPGAIIGLAALLFAFRDRRQPILKRLRHRRSATAPPSASPRCSSSPRTSCTRTATAARGRSRSKNKDASIDAWRAVAQDDRLERDQILYAIQPDGVALGPETRSLTAIAKEHPRSWLTIAWINTTTIFGDYLGHPLGRRADVAADPAVPHGAGPPRRSGRRAGAAAPCSSPRSAAGRSSPASSSSPCRGTC